jgi:hypothetical protein
VKPNRPLAPPGNPRSTHLPNLIEPTNTLGTAGSGEIGEMVVRRLSRAVLTLPNIRRRASNSWAAVRDTFFSTKVTT